MSEKRTPPAWLRLAIVVATVGGGFAGVTETSGLMTSAHSVPAASIWIGAVFMAMYLYVLVAGLWFAHNPRRLMPLVAAFLMQIPVISSPVLVYHFGAAGSAPVGIGENGLRVAVHFGTIWQFFLLPRAPLMIGCNLLAVFFFALTTAYAVARERNHSHPMATPMNQNESSLG